MAVEGAWACFSQWKCSLGVGWFWTRVAVEEVGGRVAWSQGTVRLYCSFPSFWRWDLACCFGVFKVFRSPSFGVVVVVLLFEESESESGMRMSHESGVEPGSWVGMQEAMVVLDLSGVLRRSVMGEG